MSDVKPGKPIIHLMLTAECLERLADSKREVLETDDATVIINFSSLEKIPVALRTGIKGDGTYIFPEGIEL